MLFHYDTPNFHYTALRLVSAGRGWELGLSPMQEGVRLRMGRLGRPPCVLDFCLGKDARLMAPVLAAILDRLEFLPEDSEEAGIDACFPWRGSRPDLAKHLPELLGCASKVQTASL